MHVYVRHFQFHGFQDSYDSQLYRLKMLFLFNGPLILIHSTRTLGWYFTGRSFQSLYVRINVHVDFNMVLLRILNLILRRCK
jgi:hypothetical protein